MSQGLILAGTAALLVAAASSAAIAAEPLANAGTLTCTLAPSELAVGSTQSVAEVACKFSSITGTDYDLAGKIVRMAPERERDAKVVVSWSVLAPSAEISPQQLSGRYTGTFSGSQATSEQPEGSAGTLFGSEQSGIEFRPLTVGQQNLPDAGLTVLELEIAAVKV